MVESVEVMYVIRKGQKRHIDACSFLTTPSGDSSPRNGKFTHYLLTTMPNEGWVKCVSPQNHLGVSWVNRVAAKVTSSTDLIKQQKKDWTCLHTARVASSKCHPRCKWGRLESNMNVGASGHLDDTTGGVWRHVMFYLMLYYLWRRGHDWLQLY